MMSEIVQSMPLGFFLFILAMPGLFMVLGLINAVQDFRKTREVNDNPVVPIAQAEEGLTSLEGICTPLLTGPLYAHLTGRACCWYEYKVQKYTQGDSEPSWQTIESGSSAEPILLLDHSGNCVIWQNSTEITTVHRNLWYGSTPDPFERDPSDAGYEEPAKKEYRYIEDRIHEGDPLHVMGRFTRRNIVAEFADDDPDDREPDELDYGAALPPNVAHMDRTRRISHGTSSDLVTDASHRATGALIVSTLGTSAIILLLLLRFNVIG